MTLNHDEILRQNELLKAEVNALRAEVDRLKKSFPAKDEFYDERYHRISEHANDVVYRFHFKNRKYEYISPQVKNLLGYAPEEFYSTPMLIRHIIHPDSRKAYFNIWREILKGNIPEYFELKVVKRNGKEGWVLQKSFAIYDDSQNIVSIEGILTDITARKKIEEALVESEAQKNAILNNIPHQVWLKDCNGVYLSVNKSFANRYNTKVKEIVGKTDYDIYDRVTAQRYQEEDLMVRINKEPLYIEEKRGEAYLEVIKAPIFNNNNEIIGVTGVALDITEHKKNEEEIKQYSEKLTQHNEQLKHINDELKLAKEKAENADRLKTSFLANMSHEIRTPMNAILGFATLMRDRKLSEDKQIEFINLINTNSRQLLHIISDIIDISKIESDQITLFNKNFNINSALRALKSNFESNVKAANKEIVIELVVGLPDKRAQIYTDKVRLEQILSNFLSNAVKFTERGKIECGYRIDKTNKSIVFFVSDSGIGITKEEQKVIFDRFRQVSSSYSKLYGGTGLGLSISKGLAEKLKGKISLKSEQGKGSTFYLTLPYSPGDKIKPEKIAYDTEYRWDNRTILIAEDEKANYTLLSSIIQPTNAKIIWVQNGIDAVDVCLKNGNIDLVLMDIKMPDMNGLEATKKIREENKVLPIIAQTAFAMPQDEDNSLKAGCNAYLAKPLQVEDILNKINQFIDVVKKNKAEKASEKHI